MYFLGLSIYFFYGIQHSDLGVHQKLVENAEENTKNERRNGIFELS